MNNFPTIRQISPVYQPPESVRQKQETPSETDKPIEGNTKSTSELTSEERQEVARLEQRDREVKAHEQAHKAAAGSYAKGAASYEYEVGPDGKRYAVGGEVEIDISRLNNAEENLAKAQTITRAALAPADPSAQDRRIAAQAALMEAEARQELAKVRNASTSEDGQSIKADSTLSTTTNQRALDLYKSIETGALAQEHSPIDQLI